MVKKNVHYQPPKKRGGPRENAGRKTLDDKKEPITIYVSKEAIQKSGGKLSLKVKLAASVESGAFKIKTEADVKQEIRQVESEIPEPRVKLKPGAIERRISEIEAETIPKERDTPMGRKSWAIDQQKRIEELKNKLK